jgi:predicted amidohydrolase YtcJ
LHATYDESITRFLDVFERVNRAAPLHDLHWFLDHCETISERNLERLHGLGGGIAIQHRMAFQGEYFVDRYGAKAAERTPPIRRMLEMGIPVGAGTDATRVANYNPFNSLYWLVSGRTLGGLALYPEKNRLSREEALRLYTAGSAWFSGEQEQKGTLAVGQFADLAVLTEDYFNVAEEKIRDLESVLTVVNGKPVYGTGDFADYAPPALPVMPDWSPVAKFGGYGAPYYNRLAAEPPGRIHAATCGVMQKTRSTSGLSQLWGSGCDCFAF